MTILQMKSKQSSGVIRGVSRETLIVEAGASYSNFRCSIDFLDAASRDSASLNLTPLD